MSSREVIDCDICEKPFKEIVNGEVRLLQDEEGGHVELAGPCSHASPGMRSAEKDEEVCPNCCRMMFEFRESLRPKARRPKPGTTSALKPRPALG